MNKNIIETLLGGLVIVVALFFGAKLYNGYMSNNQQQTYTVYALFNNSGGIETGADVRISGVNIGKVSKVSLDNENYKAKVEMNITNTIVLPVDSVVAISSDGLIGGKYINIKSGEKTEFVEKNAQVENSKDVVTLEEMLGKLIFLNTE